ncbi:MAG: DNA sulfur modification protein DndE [Gammaproteobacteria bacterium]|nr:DNA sulfur modification protein DndE [Gammaproteobacteria bacterium]MCW8839754.1 DNA sulfur modification protein DndE [Gammaproteobacteria bacterium]MCW8959276.1 DNA sulfur modification protein DndE [Gammaproteobacteria bacterium]MCW8992433.1 DNA sulfur modification protein DndE [Gammaproteobacteria bacterium]
MSIENIRISEKGKQQLITLKRKTGIQNWNVLCRWAFCLSLAEKSVPPSEDVPADSSVEMTWKVFAGQYMDVYKALLYQRANIDNVELNESNELSYFRIHLHRGISFLSNRTGPDSISDLLRLTL